MEFPSISSRLRNSSCGSVGTRTMPHIKTDKLRREAAECRRNAEQTTNRIDRDAWLGLADDWMKLARGEDLRIKIAGLKIAATFPRRSDVCRPIDGDSTDGSLAGSPRRSSRCTKCTAQRFPVERLTFFGDGRLCERDQGAAGITSYVVCALAAGP